jgi:hypothetical protein
LGPSTLAYAIQNIKADLYSFEAYPSFRQMARRTQFNYSEPRLAAENGKGTDCVGIMRTGTYSVAHLKILSISYYEAVIHGE